MKAHVLSDIHNEFEIFHPPAIDADVVILAGDVHVKGRAIEWIERMFPQRIVLYVLGNHEFYGGAIPRQIEKLKENAQGKDIHVLEKDSFQVDDVEFFGCTFWTDFQLFGNREIAALEAEQNMTDYRRIRVSPQFRKLKPAETAIFHSKSRDWLMKAVGESRCGKKVIITHHAPSALSLPGDGTLDILNSAYASSEDELIKELGADLWVHGHIHTASDYSVGKTRVVSNPKGYPDERASGFKADLVIEI